MKKKWLVFNLYYDIIIVILNMCYIKSSVKMVVLLVSIYKYLIIKGLYIYVLYCYI